MQLYSTFFRSKAELRIEPISSTYSYSSSAAQQQRQSISHRCNEEGRVAASRSQSRRRRRRGIHANCYLLFPAVSNSSNWHLRLGMSVSLSHLSVNFLGTSTGALFYFATGAKYLKSQKGNRRVACTRARACLRRRRGNTQPFNSLS